jgi:flagellar protein FlbD
LQGSRRVLPGQGDVKMIKLTRFNSQTNKKGEFVLNAEIIETVEETPDTVITLLNGKKLIVEEPMDEIVRRVMKYRKALKF